jgi:hypothetical protein
MRKALLLFILTVAFTASAIPLPQPPYPDPIAGAVGRYGVPNGPSFASSELSVILFSRARAKADVYHLATFPARVAAANGQMIPPDFTIDPTAPGWVGPVGFSGELNGVVFDPRGYIEISFGTNFGLGIVDTNGHLIKQIPELSGVSTLFESGGRQYLVGQSGVSGAIYDVTNPAAPTLARTLTFRPTSGAVANGDVALTLDSGELQFFTAATLLAGGAPFQTSAPGETFHNVVTDGTNFFTPSFVTAAPTTLITSMFVKNGGTYTRSSQIPIDNEFPIDLRYDGGYLVLSGYRSDNTTNPAGAIFTIDGQTLVLHDIRPFIEQNYGAPFGSGEYSLTPFHTGGREYIAADMVPASDLFILSDPNAIPSLSTWALIVLGAVVCAVAMTKMR